jgi:hypothetical protein
MDDDQASLFDDDSGAAAEWNRSATKRALDELFCFAGQYNRTKDYDDLMRFVAQFRFYSPFNAMLAHIQMPGATFVASAHRWESDYRHRVKSGARPIVILQPRGPVMFVFDVSDTDPLPDARPFPRDVERPFEVRSGRVGEELERSYENAKRDGVLVAERDAGSQSAGQIGRARDGATVKFLVKKRPEHEYVTLPVRYELLLNTKHSRAAKYATLTHELAHLYCGHLGTPDEKWWPDRRGLTETAREFEAESVCFLVCTRLGIDNPSGEYLAGYVKKNELTPPISLDCVMKAAGLIEIMGRAPMTPRKNKDEE